MLQLLALYRVWLLDAVVNVVEDMRSLGYSICDALQEVSDTDTLRFSLYLRSCEHLYEFRRK